MTAIGFVLLMIGSLVFKLFGSSFYERANWADGLGGLTAMIGFVLLVSGITKWLWRVMP